MKSIAPLFFFIILFSSPPSRAELIRVRGAVHVAVPVIEAAKVLKETPGLEVEVVVSGGSHAGITGLGAGSVDVAMSTKEVSAEEKAESPNAVFTEFPIGMQVMALAVSPDVWESGVQALSQEQIQKIYEGTVSNWKEVGGPDRKITMFLIQPGRGYWEMLVQWLYGEIKKAPERPYAKLSSAEQMINALEFTPGSIGLMPLANTNGRAVHALGILEETGVIDPKVENMVSGKYPLCRKLLLVTNDRPILGIKKLIDFMQSQPGQALVKKSGALPLAELDPAAKK